MPQINEPGPGWAASFTNLQHAIGEASRETLPEVVNEARKGMFSRTGRAGPGQVPVHNPSPAGELLVAPPQRRKFFNQPMPSQVGGGEHFIRSLIVTLKHQYPGLNMADEPVPMVLMNALSGPIQAVQIQPGVWVAGTASRSDLDQATHYEARILLRWHTPQPHERGQDVPGIRMHTPHPQAIWWNWSLRRWQTFSLLGLASGAAQGIGGIGGGIGQWRSARLSGAGYWADMEFGIGARALPEHMIPGPGETMVSLYVRLGDLGEVTSSRLSSEALGGPGFAGVRPYRFLWHAAKRLVGLMMKDGPANDRWRDRVVHHLGQRRAA